MSKPWENEPDHKFWTDQATGYPIRLRRGPHGAWCGYVGIPQTHPLFGASSTGTIELPVAKVRAILPKSMQKLCISEASIVVEIPGVHGGISFSGLRAPKEKELERISKAELDTSTWWFGFDCAHAGDLCPKHLDLLDRDARLDETYRDISYAADEAVSLAKRLATMAGGASA